MELKCLKEIHCSPIKRAEATINVKIDKRKLCSHICLAINLAMPTCLSMLREQRTR